MVDMNIPKAWADATVFMMQAGEMAMVKRGLASSELKADSTIVTETDLAISKLAQMQLKDWWEQPEHLLVDEEIIDTLGTPEEAMAKAEYLWFLDPIDGTANYATGRHNFGIMLGVVHKGQPVLGILYQPALRRLVYGTPGNVMLVTEVFTEQAQKVPLDALKVRDLHDQVYFDCSRPFFKYQDAWAKHMWINTPECSLDAAMHVMFGQSSGYLSSHGNYAWDLAALWVLYRLLGGDVVAFETGEKIGAFTPALFRENWKVADGWFFSSPKNIETLKQEI